MQINDVTTYSYDAMNRETGMTTAAGTAIAGLTTFTFDKAGNQVTSTDADNNTTTTTYDALDRQATVKTPDGGITTYGYLCSGQPGSHFFFKVQPCWVAPRGEHGRRTAA